MTSQEVFEKCKLMTVDAWKPNYGICPATNLINGNGVVFWCNKDGCGEASQTYETGQKKSEGTYKDGKEDGLHTAWYVSGQKKSERNTKDGRWDGVMTEWYENGQKKSVENYKNGEPHGLWVNYKEDGAEKKPTTYKDGKKVRDSPQLPPTLDPRLAATQCRPRSEGQEFFFGGGQAGLRRLARRHCR